MPRSYRGADFFIEETIDGDRHRALKVAKIDLTDKGISRLLVFTAVPGGIDEGDTYMPSANPQRIMTVLGHFEVESALGIGQRASGIRACCRGNRT
ncbi:hypothetical protein [uncultured Lamprocystis sp.]|uniref:hypothetical protein n=1 Tax=uncultured Lamprocystis sp. TaxID=543132 RepID=UPI0025F12A29|nr:hypothetical protein [uncultured Lamprocystis sp.]